MLHYWQYLYIYLQAVRSKHKTLTVLSVPCCNLPLGPKRRKRASLLSTFSSDLNPREWEAELNPSVIASCRARLYSHSHILGTRLISQWTSNFLCLTVGWYSTQYSICRGESGFLGTGGTRYCLFWKIASNSLKVATYGCYEKLVPRRYLCIYYDNITKSLITYWFFAGYASF